MRKVLLLLAVFSSFAMANDARINALGGSDMYRDVKDVYFNPAYITEYQVIEGDMSDFSGADEYVASVIGTWKVGKLITLGGYYTDQTTVSPMFVNGFSGVDNVVRIASPHALVGFGISEKFSLGLGMYSEMNYDKAITDANEDISYTRVFGGSIGANLYLGKLDLEMVVDGSLPQQRSTIQDDAGSISGNDTTYDYLQADGISLLGDIRATIHVKENLRLRAGIGYEFGTAKWYSLSDVVDNITWTEGDLNAILGVAKDFDFGMTFAFEAHGMMTTAKQSGIDATAYDNQANFIASAEKTFGQTKLFDNHYFRMGLSLGVAGQKVKGGGGLVIDSSAIWGDAVNSTPGAPVTDPGLALGFGFDRGKFGFDMYIENIDLDFSDNTAGILSIFPTAGASLTLDFAKAGTTLRNKKQTTVSAYESYDASTPAAVESTPSFYSQPAASETPEIIGDEN